MPQKSAAVVSTNAKQLTEVSYGCCTCLHPKALPLGEEHAHMHINS